MACSVLSFDASKLLAVHQKHVIGQEVELFFFWKGTVTSNAYNFHLYKSKGYRRLKSYFHAILNFEDSFYCFIQTTIYQLILFIGFFFYFRSYIIPKESENFILRQPAISIILCYKDQDNVCYRSSRDNLVHCVHLDSNIL